MAGKPFIFRFADVEVREREFSLTKAGERLAVEPKAFRVLLILLRNPGKLIPKQELLDAVWGDAAVTENSLARAIALLRRPPGCGDCSRRQCVRCAPLVVPAEAGIQCLAFRRKIQGARSPLSRER